MRIEQVELSDFLCWGDAQVTFPDAGAFLVAGRRGSDDTSNGAGKSSLFEAVYWALTGRTVRGTKADAVVRFGESSCSVTARLSLADGTPVEVTRSRKGRRPSLTASVGGAVIDGHTVDEVQEALWRELSDRTGGWTEELFAELVFFGRRYAAFSRLSPKERARRIEDLSGVRYWDQGRQRARARARELSSEIVAQERLSDYIERQLEELDARIEELSRELRSVKQRREDPAVELDAARNRRKSLQETKDEMVELLADVRERRAESVSDVRAIQSELQEASETLSLLEQGGDSGECPVCGAALNQSHIDRLMVRRADLQDRLQSAGKARAKWDKVMQSLVDDIAEADRELSRLDALIEELEDRLQEQTDAEREVSALLKQARAERKTKRAEADKVEAARKDLQRAMDVATYWETGFREIAAQVIRDWVEEFGRIASACSNALGGFPIDVSYSGAAGSLVLGVVRGDDVVPAELLSEGEAQRFDLACWLAYSRMVEVLLGETVQTVVMDEPLSGLDAEGRRAVFDTIADLSSDRSVAVIDHNAEFAEQFDRRLVIDRVGDGVPEVAWQ